MTTYTVEVRRGEKAIHSELGKLFPNQGDAWQYVTELAAQFDIPGLRIVGKNEEGDILLMAGVGALQQITEAAA